jgi:predicted amidohydrolase YtcJ
MISFSMKLPVLFSIFVVTAVMAGQLRAAEAVVYHGGPILTLTPGPPTVEALATRDGAIIAAGTLAEALASVGADYRTVDLAGRALLPGFYAAHDHFLMVATSARFEVELNSPPVGRVRDITELVSEIRRKAALTPRGEWIIGRGYDDTLLAERRHPTRRDLDLASTEHPIYIVHSSGHLAVANSRALALAGITAGTTDPVYGVIRREPDTREPDGVFEECGSLVARHIPKRTSEELLAAIPDVNRQYLARGVTATIIAGGSPSSHAIFGEAIRRGLLDLRVIGMVSGRRGLTAAALALPAAAPAPDRFRLGAIKILQDGSLQNLTAYLTEPYHVQPDGRVGIRGSPARSREALADLVSAWHRDGLQLAIHGNGDAAIDDILFAFEEAQRRHPRPDARHRIEHCQAVRPDQLARMHELGVTPSFFVAHVFYWGDRHLELFLGPERAARISPLRSAADHGVRFSLHNDSPVTPVNPLLLVWSAVNRVTTGGRTLGAGERIDVLTALSAVTRDAAWQAFDDVRAGTLEPGKAADLVILDRDPRAVPPASIKDLLVLETIIGGRTRYRHALSPK